MKAVLTSVASTQTSISLADFNEQREPVTSTCVAPDLSESHDSALPRELRNRIHNLFDRIEREFEREYQKLCAENYALQEKLEKFEEGDHNESSNFSKKLTASQLSHRIKQQYKQSTSRLVSTLRPIGGVLALPAPTGGGSGSNASVGAGESTMRSSANTAATASWGAAGYNRSWKLANRFVGHRDGLWEVTTFQNLLGTYQVHFFISFSGLQCSCLLVYSGHSGSVNSVRFRAADQLMLTCSGDGTAHLIRLPQKFFEVSQVGETSAVEPSNDTPAANKSHPSAVPGNSVASTPMVIRDPTSVFQSATLSFGDGGNSTSLALAEGVVESAPLAAADFLSGRNHLVTASWDRLGRLYDVNTGQEVHSLTGHDHQLTDVRCAEQLPVVVTSARDSTFRLWDFRTPRLQIHVQQAHSRDARRHPVMKLTHHVREPFSTTKFLHEDLPSDVEQRDDSVIITELPVPLLFVEMDDGRVFELLRNLTVSTAQFLPSCPPDLLISAGTDRICRLWDLRKCRSPLFTIRTDAGINRLAVLQSGALLDARRRTSLPSTVADTSTALSAPDLVPSTATSSAAAAASATALSCIFALPLDNRTVRFIDISGSRISRISRNSAQGHTRAITSVAWAGPGAYDLFTAGFDHQLLAWQLQIA
ncbi:unnamed protein product [Schistocephalus solidus]|uniref:WD repeat-containing protein 37 n=1 Tax=Schistocephalus solidus TaxID=70667 RepID=A0A183ST39_SCHSO|nr:unnamed protein product [Schistocephalus solidus]